MQLVRSEPLSEDTLSLVATDGGDSGAVHLGYNLICLWNQVSSVGSHSCHVKQVTRGSQRDETLHDSRVNINLCFWIECEVYSIKTPPVWSHRGHWARPALMKQRECRPQTLFIWVWLSKGTFAPTGPFSRIGVKHLSIVWFPWQQAASGHESLKLQTGTEDPFMDLIDKLHVISENKRNQTA